MPATRIKFRNFRLKHVWLAAAMVVAIGVGVSRGYGQVVINMPPPDPYSPYLEIDTEPGEIALYRYVQAREGPYATYGPVSPFRYPYSYYYGYYGYPFLTYQPFFFWNTTPVVGKFHHHSMRPRGHH